MSNQFKPVDPKINFPELERGIIKYWKENKIFEKSLAKEAPKGDWTFLDGPPFVTGMPHYGTLLSSIPKDLFGRYWTMKGYHVRRVWGWDGHGLPIENKVENELEIKRKRDIEEVIGVKKFIEACKHYVNDVSSEWEWYVDHIARWADFKNAYKTWDISYMESVMWVFRQMYDKGLIYKGLKVSLYCPHCGTPVSNFEVAMDADNHRVMPDAATTYKYELADEPGTFILAWSTTPWNKIVTPALAVNPKLTYVKVKQGDENYILAKTTIKTLKKEPKWQKVAEFKGKDLVGKKFVPHYDYYKIEPGKKAFQIFGGDFVTAEEGTGVVTIAAYGEEDLKLMQENNIHIETHLDEDGVIKSDVPKFGGMYYLKANEAVNEDLAKRGLIYKDEELPHSVPLCWRCQTRLYFAPINAWFVNVQSLKEKMKKTNEQVNWYPKHFKTGRYLKSLESAPDWNISRNRYWGSPVPVWECKNGHRTVPGSIKELEELSGRKITDLHKPEIDEVNIKCPQCRESAKRTPEVLDSWIEAGSASFAERHFPFDKEWKLEDFFPPDFIVEYTGQIRAWFYVLHVIAVALYDSAAYKNVQVTGVILGTDGRKMSKNYKNFPDPREMLDKYGGDALRLYLLGSPVMNGEDILISEEQYKLQVRGMMLILWNVYNFFVTYANLDGYQFTVHSSQPSTNVLDRWIISLLQKLIEDVTKSLENYNTVAAVETIRKFVDDLSTWYIRRSRDRVGPTVDNDDDKQGFYSTCHKILITLCQILAPITPFLAEEIYRNLTGEESVHLTNYPAVDKKLLDIVLIEQMKIARQYVEKGHAARKASNIKVRQPLGLFTYVSSHPLHNDVEQIIANELNVKKVIRTAKSPKSLRDDTILTTELTDELKAEGAARDLVRQIQELRKEAGCKLDEKISVTLPDWPKDFEDYIKRETLSKSLVKGEKLEIKRG